MDLLEKALMWIGIEEVGEVGDRGRCGEGGAGWAVGVG
jgi:hypothetical protein